MKKKPEKKKNKLLWMVCLVVIVAITAARLICHFCGVALSDTLVRILGGVEMVAVAVLVYSYIRWRQQ